MRSRRWTHLERDGPAYASYHDNAAAVSEPYHLTTGSLRRIEGAVGVHCKDLHENVSAGWASER